MDLFFFLNPGIMDKARPISWHRRMAWKNGLIQLLSEEGCGSEGVWEALCKWKLIYCFPEVLDCWVVSLERTGDAAYVI